jgi:hypothetical protein
MTASTNDAKNTAWRLGSPSGSGLGRFATAGSSGRIETDVRKTAVVACAFVSINRMCRLYGVLVHCELKHAAARWLSAAVYGKPLGGKTHPAGELGPSQSIYVNYRLRVFRPIVARAIADHPVSKLP